MFTGIAIVEFVLLLEDSETFVKVVVDPRWFEFAKITGAAPGMAPAIDVAIPTELADSVASKTVFPDCETSNDCSIVIAGAAPDGCAATVTTL